MSNKNNSIEVVFDCLYSELIEQVPKLIPKAKAEYKDLVRDLPIGEKWKLNFISSLLAYCEQERWTLAKSQLESAEHEYRRYLLDIVTAANKPMTLVMANKCSEFQSLISKGDASSETYNKKDYPNYAVRNRGSSRTAETRASAKEGPTASNEHASSYEPFHHTTTSLEGVQTREQIAEKFHQIQNNEWRSAMYELEQLNIYQKQEAYKVCNIEAENQISKLESAAFNIMTEGTYVDKGVTLPGNRKYLLHYRKEIADTCIERLQESFKRRYLPEIIRRVGIYQNVRAHGPIHKYANQCISICWMMVVLDPPICLVDERYSPGLFNTELYKHHTNAGNAVAYYVWPALLKYKDGPVLCKGIAQGI